MGGSAIVQAADKSARTRSAPPRPSACNASRATIAIDGDSRRSGPTARRSRWPSLPPTASPPRAPIASNKRTYSYGAHAAHVAVDPGTGHVALLDYMAVEDVGRIINPLTLHGQTVGAIVQGLGGALLEHLVYDDERPVPGRLARRLSAADRERLSRHPRASRWRRSPRRTIRSAPRARARAASSRSAA